MEWEREVERERFALAMERIRQISGGDELQEPYGSFFQKTAGFILAVEKTLRLKQTGGLDRMDRDGLKALQEELYGDILVGAYGESYANPACAARKLGRELGPLLSGLCAEWRAMIPYAYEGREREVLILCELFLQIYGIFAWALAEGEEPDAREVRDAWCGFESDYCPERMDRRMEEQLDPACDFAVRIIMDSDLKDLSYLYRFGEYITQNELETAEYLNSLEEEKLKAMADIFTGGYRMGFVRGGKDLGKKRVVNIRYALGFEQVVRRAILNFRDMGLKPTVYRAAFHGVLKNGSAKTGYYGASPNRQYESDHKEDAALFLDRRLMNRKLEAMEQALKKREGLAAVHAGPAVLEVFGEEAFTPEQKAEAPRYSDKQQKLLVEFANRAGAVTNAYIKGEERSFTIVAYPVLAIGEAFREIFEETVKINTLPSDQYGRIQQTIIDALDQAEYVRVRGMRGNQTDLKVKLLRPLHPERETAFENCVADVNIPVGEVFTTPVLRGTEGLLHVKTAYLEGFKFLDLKMEFRDGMTAGYTCGNYSSQEENRRYVKEHVLHHHDRLPMGEFAIGTNTTAYVAAVRYGIEDKLPILIAEKTGPHFAVGDTCYSYAEDVKVYNPDGREIAAKDNEISRRRFDSPKEAYFNCHTDITIPYDELGSLTAVKKDLTEIPIIENGRFVLQGCEELNQAFFIDE